MGGAGPGAEDVERLLTLLDGQTLPDPAALWLAPVAPLDGSRGCDATPGDHAQMHGEVDVEPKVFEAAGGAGGDDRGVVGCVGSGVEIGVETGLERETSGMLPVRERRTYSRAAVMSWRGRADAASVRLCEGALESSSEIMADRSEAAFSGAAIESPGSVVLPGVETELKSEVSGTLSAPKRRAYSREAIMSCRGSADAAALRLCEGALDSSSVIMSDRLEATDSSGTFERAASRADADGETDLASEPSDALSTPKRHVYSREAVISCRRRPDAAALRLCVGALEAGSVIMSSRSDAAASRVAIEPAGSDVAVDGVTGVEGEVGGTSPASERRAYSREAVVSCRGSADAAAPRLCDGALEASSVMMDNPSEAADIRGAIESTSFGEFADGGAEVEIEANATLSAPARRIYSREAMTSCRNSANAAALRLCDGVLDASSIIFPNGLEAAAAEEAREPVGFDLVAGGEAQLEGRASGMPLKRSGERRVYSREAVLSYRDRSVATAPRVCEGTLERKSLLLANRSNFAADNVDGSASFRLGVDADIEENVVIAIEEPIGDARKSSVSDGSALENCQASSESAWQNSSSRRRYSVDEMVECRQRAKAAIPELVNALPVRDFVVGGGDGGTLPAVPSHKRLRYARDEMMDLKRTPCASFDFSGLQERGVLVAVRDVFISREKVGGEEDGLSLDVIQTRPDVALAGSDEHITFEDMLLPPCLVEGLHSAGFYVPSPVQARGIPVGRLGVDVIAQAKSGTGKTVVFCVLALETFLLAGRNQNHVAALVLVPTRDIAAQVRDVMEVIAARVVPKPHVGLLIGGTPVRADEAVLRERTHSIVVGTPGRVEDLLERGSLNLSSLKLLVLDEVDRTLDGSFEGSVPAICNMVPSAKQVLTFSATYSSSLLKTLRTIMRSPQFVNLCEREGALGNSNVSLYNRSSSGEGSHMYPAPEGGNSLAVLHAVHQAAVAIPVSAFRMREITVDLNTRGRPAVLGKADSLIALLSSQPFGQAIVFTNDKMNGRAMKALICDAGFPAVYMSGGELQSVRRASMEAMRSGRARVLVSTDLVARGVDLPGCDFVVHLDLPQDSATYLHRVGRAGRFGSRGTSVIIYFESGEERVGVEHLQRQLHVVFELLPSPVVTAVPHVTESLSPGSTALSSVGGDKTETGLLSAEGRNGDQCHFRSVPLCGEESRNLSPQSTSNFKGSLEREDLLTPPLLSGEENCSKTQKQTVHGNASVSSYADFGGDAGGVASQSPEPDSLDEGWSALADSAYNDGFEHGFHTAYRMAKALNGRLGSEALLPCTAESAEPDSAHDLGK